MDSIQNRLQQALNFRGMSATELSKRCGIDKSGICRYLKGKIIPKPKATESMAKALGVSPTWLMGFDEDMRPSQIPTTKSKVDNPIDFSRLTKINKIRLQAYYQALLDTQKENS